MEGFMPKPKEKLSSQEHSKKEMIPNHNEDSEALPIISYFFDASSKYFLFELIHMIINPLFLFT